jgi:hypothetical protein
MSVLAPEAQLFCRCAGGGALHRDCRLYRLSFGVRSDLRWSRYGRRIGVRVTRLRFTGCGVTLRFAGTFLCPSGFFGSISLNLRGVWNQRAKLGRKLLYSSLSIRLDLRRIGNLAPCLNLRPNCAIGPHRSLSFGQYFLSFIQRLLAGVQCRFALGKPLFSSRILLLAGANHRSTDGDRKDKYLFHSRINSDWCCGNSGQERS